MSSLDLPYTFVVSNGAKCAVVAKNLTENRMNDMFHFALLLDSS
jgi:hypothetical protein